MVNGTLFGPASIPAGSSASPRTAFTSVSQSLTTGSGTTADPYTIVTVVDAGSTGVRLTQTDSYVVGQESWRTDVEIANTTATDASVRLYRAFDCYRADSDFGYGYADLASGTVACQSQQSDPTPLLQIAPITPGSRFYEAFYDQIWAKIGAQEAFPDTCRCDEHIDNGAGLSWDVSVPAGATEVRSSGSPSPREPPWVERSPRRRHSDQEMRPNCPCSATGPATQSTAQPGTSGTPSPT